MGSKLERQNQHQRRLKMKIKRWKRQEKDTSGLEKELGYCTGELERPTFQTGRDSDPRLKKWRRGEA